MEKTKTKGKELGNRVKKMKPGKLKGPSHKNGGVLLEAEGGEYIIKKSSVKKIGRNTLDKINKEGKLPMAKKNVVKKYTKVKGAKTTGMLNTKKDMPKRDTDVKVKKNTKIKGAKTKGLLALKKDMPKRDTRVKVKGGKSTQAINTKKDMPKRKAENIVRKREQGGAVHPPNTPKVGDSVQTYASGGYVEGK